MQRGSGGRQIPYNIKYTIMIMTTYQEQNLKSFVRQHYIDCDDICDDLRRWDVLATAKQSISHDYDYVTVMT